MGLVVAAAAECADFSSPDSRGACVFGMFVFGWVLYVVWCAYVYLTCICIYTLMYTYT